MTKLLPCPFCGEQDDIILLFDDIEVRTEIDRFKIMCRICGGSTGNHNDLEYAAERWNIRAKPRPTRNQIIERLNAKEWPGE